MPSRPRLFGHGPVDGVGSPINTLESFSECRHRGTDGVELDVRRTRDDALVVIHDAALDRHLIDQLARKELPPHVPDLASVLDECRGTTVNIELKNFPADPCFDATQRLTHLVIELLAERDGADDVIVSCFDLAVIDLVRAQAPSVPTAALLLSRRAPDSLLSSVIEHGHPAVHPYDTMVDEAFMEAARAADPCSQPWLEGGGADRMRTLVALGVDALITSEVSTARLDIDATPAQVLRGSHP